MPSPFPGMDPFIESQRWRGFHDRFISEISAALVPRVRPKYVVDIEERVYFEHLTAEDPPKVIIPDVTVVEQEEGEPVTGGTATAVATKATIKPISIPLPMPEKVREVYLTVRERETGEVVTVIEVLSPNNKKRNSDGWREYLSKRESVLLSSVHLVELDLLRGGDRMPTKKPLPEADYYALVCRANLRPIAEAYAWTLRHPLPTIPIPLLSEDPDLPLDLQAVFNAVYDRAGYDYVLDYDRPVEPPLSDEDAQWAQQWLEGWREKKPS